MNDNKENIFGSLTDLEPVTPNSNVEPNQDSTLENQNVSFTEMHSTDDFLNGFDFGTTNNTTETSNSTPIFSMNDVMTPVEPVAPVEPVSSVEPIAPVETQAVVEEQSTTSYTEIPVASVTESKSEKRTEPTMIEHPDAKISLHRNHDEDLPEIKEPTEKVDKSTIWLLVGLFVGLLLVIVALPYISKLF